MTVGNPQTRARRPPRCTWATREGRAREGRGVGLGAGRGGGRLRCREGRVTVLIVPSRSSASFSGGKPQAHHTRAAAHAAREGRGAGCGGECCEGRVGCREGRELGGVLRGMRHLPAAGNPQTRARRPPRCPWATPPRRAAPLTKSSQELLPKYTEQERLCPRSGVERSSMPLQTRAPVISIGHLNSIELELELILSQMAQKPMLRGEVGAHRYKGRYLVFKKPVNVTST